MHVGERPYVLTPSGPANLSERPLGVEAMANVLTDLLSPDEQRALRELGAVERELPGTDPSAGRFTLVAARGGDDIWVEIRRQRVPGPATRTTLPVDLPGPRPRMAPSHSPGEGRRGPTPAPRNMPAAPGALPRGAVSSASPPTQTVDITGTPPATPPGPERDAAVVLPLARSPVRTDAPRVTPTPSVRHLGIGRLLRTAAARGASSFYLMAGARPSIRIDDEVLPLENEPALGAAEVDALILELAPPASREALAGGTSAEWVSELQDVGRVRCVSFRDQRGPGAVFRLIPSRLASAEQLGLSRDIQALVSEREGLILVAGPRLSGKSTLVSAFVDLINRTRSDYIVSLETEIKFIHENRKAMVSQREVRGDADYMLGSARAALRENPDVLVIDDLRAPDLVAAAIEAADSGHLVIGAVTAHTAAAAVARLVETSPADRQTQMALASAETLRGVVAQVLLRKSGGGRIAARELLLNTPSVAALIAEGKIAQLSLAIESGRKYGMVPMNDALLAFVQSGAVDAREAYRKAYDRMAFLEQLRREGIDTSFVERLA
ncbi:MAG: ATPase, T2SS/T4P/T4SS family [Acidobacteriota bacterium]